MSRDTNDEMGKGLISRYLMRKVSFHRCKEYRTKDKYELSTKKNTAAKFQAPSHVHSCLRKKIFSPIMAFLGRGTYIYLPDSKAIGIIYAVSG